MPDEMTKVLCPRCGSAVLKHKFCTECGSSLSGAKTVTAANDAPVPGPIGFFGNPSPNPIFVLAQEPAEPSRKALSDKGLTLLVNTCKKTIATIGGDGYSEIVLYVNESDGTYWLHTYSKYVYMKEEAHASYAASKELADRVFKYIEEHDLASMKNNRGPAMGGGDYILRFRQGDQVIRLDSGMMFNNLKLYTDINGMLYSGVSDETRRWADDSE